MKFQIPEAVRSVVGSPRFERAVELGLRAVTVGAVAVSGVEVATHASEVCHDYKEAAAVLVWEATGHMPSWSPLPDPNAPLTGGQIYSFMMNGTVPPAHPVNPGC